MKRIYNGCNGPLPISNPKLAKVWVTRDGRYITLPKMELSHLKHCANKIVHDSWRLEWFDEIISELRSRGEYELVESLIAVHKMNQALD